MSTTNGSRYILLRHELLHARAAAISRVQELLAAEHSGHIPDCTQ